MTRTPIRGQACHCTDHCTTVVASLHRSHPSLFHLSGLVLIIATTGQAPSQHIHFSGSINQLRDKASSTAPYESLRYLTRLHHVPPLRTDQAAQFMSERARDIRLADVQSEQFPLNRKTQSADAMPISARRSNWPVAGK